jgi:hypothetical protein
MSTIDLATFRELLKTELPRLLREHPESRHELWGLMLESFPSREEFTALLEELRAFREDSNWRFEQQAAELRAFREDSNRRFEAIDQRFEEVDRRFESLESRMEAGFLELHRAIDRLGARWGIRNESIFRQTIAALLEESFGVQVESRFVNGEQFDVIIYDGAHILVEIAASVGPKIQETLERKRRLYAEATGVMPARVLLAAGAIHSRRAQALREAGFEVIEPEEETLT